jgi:hypothetical protein
MMVFSAGRVAAMLASSALVALAAGTAQAQDTSAPATTAAAQAQGTVTGRVFDEETGQSLRGAIVRVAGTNAQDYTTEDGRFQLPAPAGEITLQVEYVGLDPVSRLVTVPRGGNVVADVGLVSSALGGDEIVVRSAATGQALAINQQRTASGIVNIVSEEIFGPARRQYRLRAPAPAWPLRQHGPERGADRHQHPRHRGGLQFIPD